MRQFKILATTTAFAAVLFTSGCKEKKDLTVCPVCGTKATFTKVINGVTTYGHDVNPNYINDEHMWAASP